MKSVRPKCHKRPIAVGVAFYFLHADIWLQSQTFFGTIPCSQNSTCLNVLVLVQPKCQDASSCPESGSVLRFLCGIGFFLGISLIK